MKSVRRLRIDATTLQADLAQIATRKAMATAYFNRAVMFAREPGSAAYYLDEALQHLAVAHDFRMGLFRN